MIFLNTLPYRELYQWLSLSASEKEKKNNFELVKNNYSCLISLIPTENIRNIDGYLILAIEALVLMIDILCS